MFDSLTRRNVKLNVDLLKDPCNYVIKFKLPIFILFAAKEEHLI